MIFNQFYVRFFIFFIITIWSLTLSTFASSIYSSDISDYTINDFSTAKDEDRKLYYSDFDFPAFTVEENGPNKIIQLSNSTSFLNQSFSDLEFTKEREALIIDKKNNIEIQKKLKSTLLESYSLQKDKSENEILSNKNKLRDIDQKITKLEKQVRSISTLKIISALDIYKNNIGPEALLYFNNSLNFIYKNIKSQQVVNPIDGKYFNGSLVNYYIDLSVYTKGLILSNGEGNSIVSVQTIENTITKFNVLDKEYILSRIYNSKIKNLITMINDFPTTPSSFSFKNDVLTTLYRWNLSGNESKSLSVEFKESGKTNNLVQVKTEGEQQVYDPNNLSDKVEKHIGILASNNSDQLFELKKIQRLNDNSDGGWVFDYKKRLLKLGNEILFVDNEDYYGFEGLWYLAYWMNINDIAERKIFLINGFEPISLTIRKKKNFIEISKSENTLYRFIFNDSGFIEEFDFVPLGQKLFLESLDTNATIRNRNKIDLYMQSNGIIKI